MEKHLNMEQLTTLVILAAGNGSRFGGAKQFACFGQQTRTLMEYNVAHAVEAGFNHLVFITQAQQKAQLKREVLSRLPSKLKIDIVIQALDTLPQNCLVSPTRSKPLGTAHALWCAKDFIAGQFVVINADDYYGKQAFSLLKQQQNIATKSQLPHFSMIAYLIQNTLSEHGGVNRGLCQHSKNMQLITVQEVENIQAKNINGNILISGRDSQKHQTINMKKNALVSMNCWAFDATIFSAIEQELINTLTTISDDNVECYIPNVVMKLLESQQIVVDILTSDDDWFGVTYAADSAWVDNKINQLFPLPISSLAN